MRKDIYAAIQKALYQRGELVASREAIEVIAVVVADMAIREERERLVKEVESFKIGIITREDLPRYIASYLRVCSDSGGAK